MSLPLYQVDSFTNEAFRGNPAAVCLLAESKPDEWMLAVAREMALSETAFLLDKGGHYNLRWFTPTAEVDLCGHATLASAHILWQTGALQPNETVVFETRSGKLTAQFADDWITMNFPATPPKEMTTPVGLIEDLFPTARVPVLRYMGKSVFDYLVEIDSEEVLRNMQPDFLAIRQHPARGVIVTCAGNGQYDFLSRFFAPAVGVDEDPVTGSAHSCLTPYWAKKLGKPEMVAYQASDRGGELKVRLEDDRVLIAGQAVTTIRGELLG